jgi:hypothetical protein
MGEVVRQGLESLGAALICVVVVWCCVRGLSWLLWRSEWRRGVTS